MIQIENKNNLSFLNILILVLSIFCILSLVIDLVFDIPTEISKLLKYIDNISCIVFFIDFVINFRNTKNKVGFMKYGWIDLIACIPNVDFIRFGRILRLIRIVRILKSFKTVHNITEYLFKDKIKGTLSSVTIISFLMLVFSSITILQVENVENSNIKTAEDAIWWSYTTITTVGYGDKFPVTTEGRLIAMFLMTVGVGVFGTFTAYISSKFIKNN